MVVLILVGGWVPGWLAGWLQAEAGSRQALIAVGDVKEV